MLEYQSLTNEEFFEENQVLSGQNESKQSLNKLWEVIVRTNRLPDGISEAFLYEAVRDKLCDHEREVRQHALRVLMDLIPVTQPSNLNTCMNDILPEVLSILSHSSPSLRKSALDSLKKYLKFSKNYSHVMKKLLDSSENFTTLSSFLISSETDDNTIKLVVDHLWKELEDPNVNQETPAKALARIRFNLGDERFKCLIGLERYHRLQEICEMYGLPIDYSDADISDNEIQHWSDEEQIEDKVILETEITLRTGPAITMKIHEESRPNSSMGDSVEANSSFGVIQVLNDDSESDFEEAARRTPRKVRFGGESVKLRTPESDSSNTEESKDTLRITVTDAVSITTRKSLIPIRITSLPSTPLKSSKKVVKKRLHQSAPNLTRDFAKTKLPVRRKSNLSERFKIKDDKSTDIVKPNLKIKSKSNHISVLTIPSPSSSPSRIIKGSEPLSPKPIHNEIEVFHNLTRSPIRQRRPSTVDALMQKATNDDQNAYKTFNSFQLCPSTSKDSISTNETSEVYNSFKIHPILALPAPEDVRNSTFNNIDNNDPFSSSDKSSKDTDSKMSLSDQQDAPREKKNDFNSFKVCSSASDVSYANTETCQDEILINDVKQNGFDLNKQWQISSFSSDYNSSNKSEDLDNLIKMLKQQNTCENLEPGPAALLFEALFACRHLDKLNFLVDDALQLMVKGIRPEVLEQCLGRLSIGICKIGAPSGITLTLLVMKKCPARRVLSEIMDRCFAHRTREGALQVLMASARLLPRNELEVLKMTEFAAASLRDRRRKVRHATLETLATLAQLTSNAEVLDVVERVTKASPDNQYLVRVVRTRLSRRQLPTVDLDGTVRYSTPRDQTELEWLSGRNNTDSQSESSSASSSNNSVNYWKHNSRHDDDDIRVASALSSIKDDSANGNQQIWAVDPGVFTRNGHVKENSNRVNPSILRPVYILQPEVVSEGGKGHRRYDRGRSFSPPKPSHKPPPSFVAASTTQQHLITTPRQFKYREGVKKSFSSEQLFLREKEHHEPYSFSLSSRSSTTSTGSSTKSGTWHKDMRSGIPVPISSETKFRLRTNATSSNSASGPVIARRSALGTVPNTPVITYLSPRGSPVKNNINVLPPQSSGSESSGYFTPPPETKKAFVKLDSVDRTSESEEKEDVENDANNNVETNVDEVDNVNEFVKSDPSASSAETTTPNEESIIETNSSKSEVIEKEEPQLRKFSISQSKESLFTEKPVPVAENRIKSKSVVDLQSFLPEISPSRKNSSSAPLFKDDLLSNGNLVISSYEEIKTVIPITQSDINDNPESPTKEIVITRKLTRRLSRTQSKRSTKSTPREPTPSTSRANSKSKDSLQVALSQLNNPEWEVMIQGLQTLTRVAKYYPEIIEGQMHTVCINLAKHIKNLRSQVARAACHTASELFGSCKRGLDVEFEEIAGPLLHRSADTNKFLRADANAALDVMCEHLPISRVVSVISSRGCTHQNSIVRSTSIRLMTDLVKRHGAEKVFHLNKDVKDKIILAGANALTDGSLDARSRGKELLSHLIGHPQFQKTLLEVVPQTTLRHIAKTLNSVKPFVET